MELTPGSGLLSELAEVFQRDGDAVEVLRRRSAYVDATVRSAVETLLKPLVTSRFAVIACGGYGRSELFPCSDIDLIIVVAAESDLASLKTPFPVFFKCFGTSRCVSVIRFGRWPIVCNFTSRTSRCISACWIFGS